MADVQKYFIQFHDQIKLSFDSNATLRDKRNLVLHDLQKGLRRNFGADAPQFTYFNQGSYELKTGVYPLNGDFDIDVGIVFKLDKNDFSPTRVKQWVYDALSTKNRTVYYQRPCITVQYHQNGEEIFHVDLAIYTEEETFFFKERIFYLARGYAGSEPERKLWEPAEPFELLHKVKKRFDDAEDRAQFRRTVRCLKRWNDLNFRSDGNHKPRGIAITALAYNLFRPHKTYNHSLQKYFYSDLKAIRNFVSAIIWNFDWLGNISVELPVKPYNNLFEKMSNKQMKNFKDRLLSFRESLDCAAREKNVEDACDILRQELGDDFCPID